MYPRLLLLLFLFLLGTPRNHLEAQGIQFFEGTWQEALVAASQQDKLIFVDAYAVWCGPCKRMAREVFTKKEVADFFNRNFINLKLDMEKGEGLVFREKYPVSAFPTLFFIDRDEEVVHKVVGGQTVEGLLRLGQFALRKVDDSGEYVELFEKGNRDPELALKYITALNKAGKPSLKVVNTYLASQNDLTTEMNRRILFEGAIEADSRVFDLLINDRAAIEQLIGKEKMEQRIESACTATLMKAIEFNVPELHQLAVTTMKTHYASKSEDFSLDADLQFHKLSGNLTAYLSACEQYAAKRAKVEPVGIGQLALQLMQEHHDQKEAVKTAFHLADVAARHATNYEPLMSQAQVYKIAGKKKEAIKAAEKAKKLAAEDARMVQSIEQFIQDI